MPRATTMADDKQKPLPVRSFAMTGPRTKGDRRLPYAAAKLDDALLGWHHESREMALVLAEAHGIPDEITATRVAWFDVGPWLSTVVHACPAPHHWPLPHYDVIEHTLAYRTPERLDEIVAFHGGLSFQRTRGQMSICCASEAVNRCAVNLADDMANGRVPLHAARVAFAMRFANAATAITDPYLAALQFGRQVRTADPDDTEERTRPPRSLRI